jgi:hypothetical protein
MSKPEAKFRMDLKLRMKRLHPISIENALCTPGLPDVNITTGWIELKVISKWPVRETTPVRIEHFTDEQKRWALRRAACGGNYWLVVKVRAEIFVFGPDAAQSVGEMTRAEMLEAALAYWPCMPSSEELCKVFDV